MKNKSLSRIIRFALSLSGLMLLVVLIVPMWRIDLDAPQYPEGLRLLIYPHKLGGNVDIINGLNHYIGMKTLHTEDFFEFTILPYLITGFALVFLFTGIFNKRKLMYVLLFLFIAFGIVAMADFWQWEYNYGHNLNPDAAIIVPGMAYQPPLIGFKQLLNFGAYSIPDIGGWLFIGAGIILLLCVITDFRSARRIKKTNSLSAITILIASISIYSCSVDPSALRIGIDNCSWCKMTIANSRFGAEIITRKGKILKYDEIGCLLQQIKNGEFKKTDIDRIYSVDFCGNNQLFPIEKCRILKSPDLRSPMGSNLAAFSNSDSLTYFKLQLAAEEILWKNIYN